ncbi:MAG: response regulator [Vicinamibacteraceae bacterium]|nr:response regulator [Vicinamibacteraceae bacterium]
MTPELEKADVPILVVADPQDDLKGLVEALAGEVKPITILTDEDRALQAIAEGGPLVLVLAFSRLELSQAFYLRTLKRGPRERLDALQTLVLCDRTEARKTYDLARDDVVDDYLVARPLYDPWQFALSVKQARDRLAMRRWVVGVTGGAEAGDIGGLVDALDEAVTVQAPANARLRDAVANLRAAVTGLSVQLIEGARMVEASRNAREAATSRPVSSMGLQAERTAPGQSPESSTILVIDDDDFYQRVVRRVLESAGHHVVGMPSAETGLAALRQERVDLVLMDVELPGMTGIEATRRIRQQSAAAPLPVIVLTRHSEQTTVAEALDAGATDFIVKPGSRETLLLKVRHALGRRTAGRASADAAGRTGR